MNALACPISVRVSNPIDNFNQHFDLGVQRSSVVYNLRPGLYDLDVRLNDACQVVENAIKKYQVQAVDEQVRLAFQQVTV